MAPLVTAAGGYSDSLRHPHVLYGDNVSQSSPTLLKRKWVLGTKAWAQGHSQLVVETRLTQATLLTALRHRVQIRVHRALSAHLHRKPWVCWAWPPTPPGGPHPEHWSGI